MVVKLFIDGPCGRITEIELRDCEFASCTVLQLKKKIEAIVRYPENQQQLFYADKYLEDDRTLSGYGIGHGSSIQLNQRSLGAGSDPEKRDGGMGDKDGTNGSCI